MFLSFAATIEQFLLLLFFCLLQKKSNKRKRQPRVFSDPLTARFLSQTSRSSRYLTSCKQSISLFRASLFRLAFNGIFAEWVPR